MVKSQLIAGPHNPSHQDKVLSEMEVLKTLDQVSRLLALESTATGVIHWNLSFRELKREIVSSIIDGVATFTVNMPWHRLEQNENRIYPIPKTV